MPFRDTRARTRYIRKAFLYFILLLFFANGKRVDGVKVIKLQSDLFFGFLIVATAATKKRCNEFTITLLCHILFAGYSL